MVFLNVIIFLGKGKEWLEKVFLDKYIYIYIYRLKNSGFIGIRFFFFY